MKIKLIKLLTLSVLLLSTLSSCQKKEEVQQQLLPVKVLTPITEKLIEWDEYTGRFEAIDKVEVRARVSGYLESIHFKDGDYVDAGKTLFIIDQRPFDLAVKEARAKVESVEAQKELSNRNLERAEKLLKAGAISRQDYDSRFEQEKVTQAELARANAALNTALLNLKFTEVKAPISGRISRHTVSKGNLISGGDTGATVLTTIVSTDPIYFYFDASEAQLLKYIRLDRSGEREASRSKANPVFVKLIDEDDFVHEGHMNFVDNEVDQSTGTIQGRAIFKNSDGILEPGMFGRARLPGSGLHDALLVPDDVIGTDQNQKFVYIVDAENKVALKFIEIGPLHNENLRIVRSGLDGTEKVIINNLMKIRPGMPVQVETKETGEEA